MPEASGAVYLHSVSSPPRCLKKAHAGQRTSDEYGPWLINDASELLMFASPHLSLVLVNSQFFRYLSCLMQLPAAEEKPILEYIRPHSIATQTAPQRAMD
jgi:hypothetical protein